MYSPTEKVPLRKLRAAKKNQRAKMRNAARRADNIEREKERIQRTAEKRGGMSALSKEDLNFLLKHDANAARVVEKEKSAADKAEKKEQKAAKANAKAAKAANHKGGHRARTPVTAQPHPGKTG